MSFFHKNSIKRKMINLSILTNSLILVLACLAFLIHDIIIFRKGIIRNIIAQAETVGLNSGAAILFKDPKAAKQTLSALNARASLLVAGIYDEQDKPFAMWKREENAPLQLPPLDAKLKKGYRFGPDSIEVLRPITLEQSLIGWVYIRSDLRELRTQLAYNATIAGFILFLSLWIIWFSSKKLADTISEPIIGVAKTAQEIAEHKDYSVRVVNNSTEDEVGVLVNTFNEMLNQTQLSQDALKKSHEQLEQRVQERTAQLENANRESSGLNKFLDSIIENIPDMVFVKDAKDLRFVRFNRYGEDMLGFSRKDLIGKNDYDFFPKEEADFFVSKDREVLTSGKLIDIQEEPIQTKSLGSRILHTKKIPILDENGIPQYLLGISEDITERKQIEAAVRKLNEELRQKAVQLELTNKELESFSYSVSHDLRAPLRSINGFSKALVEDYFDKLGADGQEDLNRIRAASERMGLLIDDMLNLSRITLSPMKQESMDLSAIAQSIVAELKKIHPERSVVVKIQDNIAAIGDSRLMRIALENLIENAWKYTSKVAVATIEFGMNPSENGPIYFVRDNGAGFDMTYAAKLFGAFQRLHTEAEFSGTGIGLATVRRIISRHHGRIWAESEIDKGATFYFTLF